MIMRTAVRGTYKKLNKVIFLSIFSLVVFVAGCRDNGDQENDNFRMFGDVKLEYYSEDPIHPQLLVEIGKQKEKHPNPEEYQLRYESDGHLYTTFIVARLAGLDLERSYLLSYFSQLPDEERAFTALQGVFYFRDSDLRRQVVSTLHSLHGGATEAVKGRQNGLLTLVAESFRNKTLHDWQIGIITHATADSFAHTYEKDGKLVAYGHRIGHLMHGHKPDTIALYPDKYKEYVLRLFEALNIKQKKKTVLSSVLELIPKLKQKRRQAVAQFENLAKTLGFNKEQYERIGMRKRNTITKDDIKDILRTMEKWLGIASPMTNDLTMQIQLTSFVSG